jgi:hypothetical protein
MTEPLATLLHGVVGGGLACLFFSHLMPDFLTNKRRETILNSDICEKLGFLPTRHHGEKGLP